MATICMLGASTSWVPGLVTDLMAVFEEPLEVRLIDINPDAGALGVEWCEAANKHHGRHDRFRAFTDRREALTGADAVLITLAIGGLAAMEHDLAIPEKYGIYTTVGDTAGPSGWARAIRNIPTFAAFAADFQELCPQALIVNYSNPMAALTSTLQQRCPNPIVGLCHSYFETKDFIQKLFGLEDWSKVSLSIAGMNHFTWVVDFHIGREDGYKLLREKLAGRSLRDLMAPEYGPEAGFFAGSLLCAEMYDAFGYIPYPGDRHISEFVSFALCGSPERCQMETKEGASIEATRYCSIKRTTIEQRRAWVPERERSMHQWIAGEKGMPTKSRETGAEMIRAYLENRPLTDAVNVRNVGQIPGLPAGACVETFGVVDGMGVRPVMVESVPEHLLEIMRPQAVCQKWITEGVLSGDRELLLQALHRDPQSAHLKPHEVRAMGGELLEANREFFRL